MGGNPASGRRGQKDPPANHKEKTEEFKEKIDEFRGFQEAANNEKERSQISKRYDNARNGIRENTEQR